MKSFWWSEELCRRACSRQPQPVCSSTTNFAGTVGMQWNGVAGAASYLLEAGTAAGLANLVTLNVATTSFSAGNVGAGTYFVRVRARTLCPIERGASTLSTPSNEITIVVTGSSPAPPPQPPPRR